MPRAAGPGDSHPASHPGCALEGTCLLPLTQPSSWEGRGSAGRLCSGWGVRGTCRARGDVAGPTLCSALSLASSIKKRVLLQASMMTKDRGRKFYVPWCSGL